MTPYICRFLAGMNNIFLVKVIPASTVVVHLGALHVPVRTLEVLRYAARNNVGSAVCRPTQLIEVESESFRLFKRLRG